MEDMGRRARKNSENFNGDIRNFNNLTPGKKCFIYNYIKLYTIIYIIIFIKYIYIILFDIFDRRVDDLMLICIRTLLLYFSNMSITAFTT